MKKLTKEEKMAKYQAEMDQGSSFLKNLNTKIKKSKQKTKINAHKADWVKKLHGLQKQETELEDYLAEFIRSKAPTGVATAN